MSEREGGFFLFFLTKWYENMEKVARIGTRTMSMTAVLSKSVYTHGQKYLSVRENDKIVYVVIGFDCVGFPFSIAAQ